MSGSKLWVLGLIPARGGSKGVPGKNIKSLGGKPLLQYTAEAALQARRLARVILSTDDEAIADVGRSCGLEVPFMRPDDLARDDTPTLFVAQHAIDWVESEGCKVDAVCLLQPTSPLRGHGDVDACIDLLESADADAVITVLPVPAEYNPHWVYFRNQDGSLRLSTGEPSPVSRRQDLEPAYHRDGGVYVTRRDVVMRDHSLYGKRLVGYVPDVEMRVNIDTEDDWELAEQLLRRWI